MKSGIGTRTLSLLLALAFCVTLLPAGVLAAEPETAAAEQPAPQEAPADAPEGREAVLAADYAELVLYEGWYDPWQMLYQSGGSEPGELTVPGASYDAGSNTLTLNGVQAPDVWIDAINMPGLKINLVGSSVLKRVQFNISAPGGTLEFTGSGSLTLTGSASTGGVFPGIRIQGGDGNTALVVGPEVHMSVSGAPALEVSNTSAAQPVVIGGEASGTAGHPTVHQIIDIHSTDSDFVWSDWMLYRNEGATEYRDSPSLYAVKNVQSGRATRITDQMEHDYVRFDIAAAEWDEAQGIYTYDGRYYNKYFWDDTPGFDPSNDLEDFDGSYVPVMVQSEAWSLLDGDGYALREAAFAPRGAAKRPAVTVPERLTATVGEAFQAQLSAAPGNAGGVISGWKLGGSAAQWLRVDRNGLLSGTPAASGEYDAVVTATETWNGTTVESLPKALTVRVVRPGANVVFLDSASETGGLFYLTVRRAGEEAVLRSVSLGKAVTRGQTLWLGDLGQGDYTLSLTCEIAEGTYDFGGGELTVAPGRDNLASVTPVKGSLTAKPGSFNAVISNYADVQSLDPQVRLTVDGVRKSTVRPDAAGRAWFGRALGRDKAGTVELVVYDSRRRETVLASGTVAYPQTELTLTAGAALLRSYTVRIAEPAEGVTLNYLDLDGEWLSPTDGAYLLRPDETENLAGRLSAALTAPDAVLREYDASAPAFTVEGSEIVIRLPERTPTREISGKVTFHGAPLAGVLVQADQSIPAGGYGSLNVSLRAVTDENGRYTLRVYPGIEGWLSAYSANVRLNLSGSRNQGSIAAGTEPVTDRDLTVKSLTVTARLTFEAAEGQQELLYRYLRALSYTVSSYAQLEYADGTETKSARVHLYQQYRQDSLAFTGSENPVGCGPDAALTVRFVSAMAENPPDLSVNLTGGAAAAAAAVAPKPGVLLRIRAERTNGYFLAWYGADGAFRGCSDELWAYSSPQDMAAICPGEPGSYTVALVHSNNRSAVCAGGTLDEAQALFIESWPAVIEAGKVTDLGEITVSAARSDNDEFYTKPASTLSLSSPTLSAGGLVSASGSIALDSGLTGGRLHSLRIVLDNNTNGAAQPTYPVLQSLTLGGKRYTPAQGSGGAWSFNVTDVSLPCTCTLTAYNQPGCGDLHIRAEASVSWSGGSTVYGQLVGEATAREPGWYLGTPSAWVNRDTVTLRGSSRRSYSAVTLYDNGAAAGTVTTDGAGRWSAELPLLNTDSALTTAHLLYAVDASGAVSRTVTVLHRAGGPQLESLTWNRKSVTYAGGTAEWYYSPADELEADGSSRTYTYSSAGLREPRFTARFGNPDALEALPGYGDGTKVLFKVFLGDGRKLFLPGERNGDTYTAAYPGTLYTWISRIECVWNGGFRSGYSVAPETAGAAGGGDSAADFAGNGRLTPTDQVKAQAEQVADLFEVFPAGYTAQQNYQQSFGSFGEMLSALESTDEPAFRVERNPDGSLTASREDVELDGALKEYADAMHNAGLDIQWYSVDPHAPETVAQWLRTVEQDKLENSPAAAAVYSDLRILYTEADYENAKAEAARYATVLVNGAVDAQRELVCYVYSDSEYDEDGNEVSGTYTVFLSFFKEGESGCRAVSVSVGLTKDFAGFGDALPAAAVQADGQSCSVTSKVESASGDATNAAGGTGVLDLCTAAANEVPEATRNGLGSFFAKNAGWLGNVTKGAGILSLITGSINIVTSSLHMGDRCKTCDDLGKKISELISSDCFSKLSRETQAMLIKDHKDYKVMKTIRNVLDVGLSGLTNAATGIGMFFTGAGLICAGPSCGVSLTCTVGGLVACGVGIGLGAFGSWINEMTYSDTVSSAESTQRLIRSYIRRELYNDPNCNNSDEDGDGGKTPVYVDPSGVVYEAVGSNVLPGAEATLYYVSDSAGNPVLKGSEQSAAALRPAGGLESLEPDSPTQTVGADGRYAWLTPPGLWYVEAAMPGYAGGSSDGDIAAASTVTVNGRDYRVLPVPPEQMDVNIPLVRYDAPVMAQVLAREEGVYITFSRYMDDATLPASAFTLSDSAGSPIPFTLEKLDSELAPDNRLYDGSIPSYTSAVLLAADLTPGQTVTVGSTAGARSYAGVAMAEESRTVQTAASENLSLSVAPADSTLLSDRPGEGTVYTLQASQPGATVWYTTDGTSPAPGNGTRARSGDSLSLPDGAALSAAAILPGCRTAAAGAMGRLTWSFDPGSGTVTVTGLSASGGQVMAASYTDGKLSAIQRFDSDGGKTVGTNFDTLKLFWLDGNAVPRSAASVWSR